jgi:DUF971 family protein
MLQDLVRSAGESTPFDATAVPDSVVLTADRARLRLTWPSGAAVDIPAARLRAGCRCAWCTRQRIDGTFAASFETIAIDRVMPVGDYALNIAFNDEHARGIYPWVYLRKLAQDTGLPAIPNVSGAHDGPDA